MQLKRNLIANYIGQFWTALMGFAFIPIYIKYLGIEAYGLIGIFTLTQAMIAMLDFGISPTIFREVSRFSGNNMGVDSLKDLLRSLECILILFTFITIVLIWLNSDWLSSHWVRVNKLDLGTVSQSFKIIGVVVGLRFLEGIYRNTIIALQKQVFYNLLNTAASTLRWLGAVAVLKWGSPTIQAFFIWQGLVSILTLIFLIKSAYYFLPSGNRPARFSSSLIKRVSPFAGGVMLITLSSFILGQLDKLILSKVITLEEFGIYSLCAMGASLIYNIATPIQQAFLPRLNQYHASLDNKTFVETYHQTAQLLTVTVGSAAIVLSVFSQIVLQLWTHNTVLSSEGAILLAVLCIGNFLNILIWLPTQTQLVFGWTSLSLKMNLFSVLILVPLFFYLIPIYRGGGAACIWMILNLGYLFFNVSLMHKRILLLEKWSWFLQDVLIPLIGSTVVAFLFYFFVPKSLSVLGNYVYLMFVCLITFIVSALSASIVRRWFFAKLINLLA